MSLGRGCRVSSIGNPGFDLTGPSVRPAGVRFGRVSIMISATVARDMQDAQEPDPNRPMTPERFRRIDDFGFESIQDGMFAANLAVTSEELVFRSGRVLGWI